MSSAAAGHPAVDELTSNSYVNYLQSILNQWPEYWWLHRRMRSLGTSDVSFVSIYDFRHETSGCQDFIWGQDGDHTATLRRIHEDTKSRVVILSSQAGNFNKGMMNAVGSIYDIDPLFFWRHFDHLGERKDQDLDNENESNHSAPWGLSSDTNSMHIGFRVYLHASIKLLDQGMATSQQCPTGESSYQKNKRLMMLMLRIVLILLSESARHQQPAHSPHTVLFERPSCRDSTLCERKVGEMPLLHFQLRQMLRTSTTARIQGISRAPLSVVIPFLELYNAERLVMIQKEVRPLAEFAMRKFARLEDYEFETSIYHGALWAHQQSFTNTLRSLKTFTNLAPEQGWDEQLSTRIEDLNELLKMTNDGLAVVNQVMLQWSTNRSLRDSHDSVKYADSVGIITVLAFIYIPLSFITSFFGMNLEIFGSGNVDLWLFFVTIVILSIITLAIWLVSGWISRWFRTLSSRFDGFWRHRRLWKPLAMVAPVKAFWMFGFMLSHPPDYYELALVYLGFKNLDRSDGPWEPPRYADEQTILHERLTPFWTRKLQDITTITAVSGWWNRRS